MQSRSNSLYVLLCVGTLDGWTCAADGMPYQFAQATFVLCAGTFIGTNRWRQPLFDRAGFRHATVLAGDLPVLEKATAECGAQSGRARIADSGAVYQHLCAGQQHAAGHGG